MQLLKFTRHALQLNGTEHLKGKLSYFLPILITNKASVTTVPKSEPFPI